MNRLVRSVAIGSGAALAVAGSVYIFEQQQLSRLTHEIHLSPEWGFETRKNVLRAASLSYSPVKQVECYEQAIASIANSKTNLRLKSQDWLTGYADLLRSLAIARAESRNSSDAEILDPLKAAATIPVGNPDLRAGAAALAFQISSDPKFLDAGDLSLPLEISTELQLKRWGQYEMEIAQQHISKKDYSKAMEVLLSLHRSIGNVSDPLCFQPSAGGYIAQIMWKLGKPDEARRWLEISEKKASECSTPACRETTEMLRLLFAKASRKNS